jgi:transcriptional regulator with XRE-family HTH domain
VNSQSSLAVQLREKEYRDAFVASQIRIGLPMQCRALRESREWTQPQLAEAAGMSQPRISEIERPGERKLNLETLLRLASAFDVALQVRFVPFSQLVDDDDSIHFDSFEVAKFENDMARLEKIEEDMKAAKSVLLSDLKSDSKPTIWKVFTGSQRRDGLDYAEGRQEHIVADTLKNSSSVQQLSSLNEPSKILPQRIA